MAHGVYTLLQIFSFSQNAQRHRQTDGRTTISCQ